jgi:hypothetical protein
MAIASFDFLKQIPTVLLPGTRTSIHIVIFFISWSLMGLSSQLHMCKSISWHHQMDPMPHRERLCGIVWGKKHWFTAFLNVLNVFELLHSKPLWMNTKCSYPHKGGPNAHICFSCSFLIPTDVKNGNMLSNMSFKQHKRQDTVICSGLRIPFKYNVFYNISVLVISSTLTNIALYSMFFLQTMERMSENHSNSFPRKKKHYSFFHSQILIFPNLFLPLGTLPRHSPSPSFLWHFLWWGSAESLTEIASAIRRAFYI